VQFILKDVGTDTAWQSVNTPQQTQKNYATDNFMISFHPGNSQM